jgi:hypothetical protein
MPQKLNSAIAAIGVDIGKNSFHIVGHDQCGAIVLRQKWSRAACLAATAEVPPIPAVTTRGPQFTLRAKTGREQTQQRGSRSQLL